MNSGLYAACSGLIARMNALDTIASNLSNSSSAGFQGQKDSFGTMLRQVAGHGSLPALNRATNTYSLLAGSHLDVSQGVISRTGNSLDVAIEGPGYFKIQTANGVAYTRNGSFQLDSTGRLTTATGDPVLGDGGPITIGSGPVSIAADGTISSAGAVCGKLLVVRFAPGGEPVHRGGGYYSVPAGTKEETAEGVTIQQGALEGSNVEPVTGTIQLISAQRAAESMRHALTLLDADMNKTAVQDLARVS